MASTGKFIGLALIEMIMKFCVLPRNVATNWMSRATIVAGTAGQQYVDNIFENYENDYELLTVNNSM